MGAHSYSTGTILFSGPTEKVPEQILHQADKQGANQSGHRCLDGDQEDLKYQSHQEAEHYPALEEIIQGCQRHAKGKQLHVSAIIGDLAE